MKFGQTITDEQRHEILMAYSRLIRRYGFDRVLYRIEQGALHRAVHTRAQAKREINAATREFIGAPKCTTK